MLTRSILATVGLVLVSGICYFFNNSRQIMEERIAEKKIHDAFLPDPHQAQRTEEMSFAVNMEPMNMNISTDELLHPKNRDMEVGEVKSENNLQSTFTDKLTSQISAQKNQEEPKRVFRSYFSSKDKFTLDKDLIKEEEMFVGGIEREEYSNSPYESDKTLCSAIKIEISNDNEPIKETDIECEKSNNEIKISDDPLINTRNNITQFDDGNKEAVLENFTDNFVDDKIKELDKKNYKEKDFVFTGVSVQKDVKYTAISINETGNKIICAEVSVNETNGENKTTNDLPINETVNENNCTDMPVKKAVDENNFIDIAAEETNCENGCTKEENTHTNEPINENTDNKVEESNDGANIVDIRETNDVENDIKTNDELLEETVFEVTHTDNYENKPLCDETPSNNNVEQPFNEATCSITVDHEAENNVTTIKDPIETFSEDPIKNNTENVDQMFNHINTFSKKEKDKTDHVCEESSQETITNSSEDIKLENVNFIVSNEKVETSNTTDNPDDVYFTCNESSYYDKDETCSNRTFDIEKDETSSIRTFSVEVEEENMDNMIVIKVKEEGEPVSSQRMFRMKVDEISNMLKNTVLNKENGYQSSASPTNSSNESQSEDSGISTPIKKRKIPQNSLFYDERREFFRGNISEYLFRTSNMNISHEDLRRASSSEIYLWNFGCLFIINLLKNNRIFYNVVHDAAIKYHVPFPGDGLNKLCKLEVPEQLSMGDNYIFSLGREKKEVQTVDRTIRKLIKVNFMNTAEMKLFDGRKYVLMSYPQKMKTVDMIYNNFLYIFNILINKNVHEKEIKTRPIK
ncbi:hypothetical protein NGRA_1463 [Nosema granulosis]|uniref:Uncharacterized protein n=1 Tax=Nosema granulosis TaxID=83296 RepID=A0A9P6H1Q8_9MICR|nr:hypothetical protein NGRA_1463 [Nosema granulosis]